MNKIRHAFLFHVLMSNIRKPELEWIFPNSANTVLTSGTKISLQSSLHKHRLMLPDKFLEITKLSFESKAHLFHPVMCDVVQRSPCTGPRWDFGTISTSFLYFPCGISSTPLSSFPFHWQVVSNVCFCACNIWLSANWDRATINVFCGSPTLFLHSKIFVVGTISLSCKLFCGWNHFAFMQIAVPPQGHGWFCARFVVIPSRPRRHVRNKGYPCDPVELVEGNQTYSVTRLGDGQESTVSTSDLAPFPRSPAIAEELPTEVASHPTTTPSGVDSVLPNCLGDPPLSRQVHLPVAEHWLLSVTAVCRCASPTSVDKSQETPW